MHTLTPLIAVGLALLCGCAHDDEMHFRPFVMQQALKHGARPVTTNNLPAIAGEWRYSEDQHGVVLQLPLERFDDVQAFLRQTFGRPAQEPTDTTTGGKLGWYAAKTIGVGLQFGYDRERTQVIVVRSQPASEIIKPIPEALERNEK